MGIARVVSLLQTLSYGVLFLGDFPYKVHVFIGGFIVNSFATSMVATGAFEVIYDGEVVFSKLETDR